MAVVRLLDAIFVSRFEAFGATYAQLTVIYYTVVRLWGYDLKGIEMILGISSNLEAVMRSMLMCGWSARIVLKFYAKTYTSKRIMQERRVGINLL